MQCANTLDVIVSRLSVARATGESVVGSFQSLNNSIDIMRAVE